MFHQQINHRLSTVDSLRFVRGFLHAGICSFLALPALTMPLNAQEQSLKQAASGVLSIGVGISDQIAKQPDSWELLNRHFSIVTPENCMKPDAVQHDAGIFNFDTPDQFVEFARSVRRPTVVRGSAMVHAASAQPSSAVVTSTFSSAGQFFRALRINSAN